MRIEHQNYYSIFNSYLLIVQSIISNFKKHYCIMAYYEGIHLHCIEFIQILIFLLSFQHKYQIYIPINLLLLYFLPFFLLILYFNIFIIQLLRESLYPKYLANTLNKISQY